MTRWSGSSSSRGASPGGGTPNRGAEAGEAHFTRVVREGGAPDEVPEHALPDGDPVHLPAVISAAFGLSTSEARRMIAQGGVKLDGEPRLGARRAARGPRRQAPPGGQASLREARRSRFLTGLRGLLHSFGRPRGRHRKALRHWSAFARFGYDLFVPRRFGGLWRERRPFRCPPSPASVLENSTACVCDEKRRRVEPIRSAGWGRLTSLPVNLASTSRWWRGLTPFERRPFGDVN